MRYRYTRYTGEELEGVDLEDLISKLSDLLLSSGFNNPYDPQDASDQNVQDLHDAILEALLSGGMLPQETLERLLGDPADSDSQSKLEQLIKQIIEAMAQRGYITMPPDLDSERMDREGGPAGGNGPDLPPVRFEVTDKSLDFLGYRALRDLLGSLGKSSYGRHDTREQATGVETTGAPKPYEFGDTMNLDAAATLLNAAQRQHERGESTTRLHVTHEDLMVVQGEYQSSCATVLMLDCSHSMILYGEDRFTPAKRVAMALSHLIRTQYPGDKIGRAHV